MIHILHPNQKRDHEQSCIPVTFYKNNGNNGGKLLFENRDSTRLQKLLLMSNTYFGAIHYEYHRKLIVS